MTDVCDLEVKGIPAILLECVDDPDPIEINGTLTYKTAGDRKTDEHQHGGGESQTPPPGLPSIAAPTTA